MTESVPLSVEQQIKSLSQAARQIRASVLPMHDSLPPTTLEELSHLESSLFRIAQEVGAFTEERKNLLALTQVGQIINSSLELDEVLRIVMDNIIALTGAERGFLMLRDESGQMSTLGAGIAATERTRLQPHRHAKGD
ncbi:MAG: hypothetical protein NT121_18040 [Chloroflexi bacterium]|nr:hypothetical protein [Chloroflexota bacterium]